MDLRMVVESFYGICWNSIYALVFEFLDFHRRPAVAIHYSECTKPVKVFSATDAGNRMLNVAATRLRDDRHFWKDKTVERLVETSTGSFDEEDFLPRTEDVALENFIYFGV